MNTCRVVSAIVATLALLEPVRGHAQDSMTQAKALYASADYEQALTLFQSAGSTRETHYYRALCLIALGRVDAADEQISAVVSLDPMFVPESGEVSPRVAAAFSDTRRRLLPQIARKTFSEAKQLFQSGEREQARGRFELTLRMLEDSLLDEDTDLADLKLVASGFLDLARSEAKMAAAATASASPAPPAAGPAAVESGRTGGVATLPITNEQTLPPWRPDSATARRSFSGAVRVEIDEKGRVTAARMEKSVHPSYDVLVLAAARRWTYQPATLNGVPVASEKTVEIQLRPDR